MKRLILLFLVMFCFYNIAGAADAANASSTTILEGNRWVIYYGTITFGAAGGTDNATSSAFYIGECNLEYGGIQVYFTDGAGTEDANGFLQYSNDPDVDLTYFTSTTYSDLDQIQVTAKYDTIGINNGVNDPFKYMNWMVLKLDGQSGNPNSSVCNFFIFLHKKEGAPKTGVGRVKNTT